MFEQAHQRLQAWYKNHGRHHLPWRVTSDPYPIYLSEIMLQQTQVQTVLDRFYGRFLARFPTLASLGEADHQEVLQYWQGLGYYRRALYLHQTAKITGGKLPDTVEGLQQLPGIGRNTASAIAAFAYRQPVAIMEANLRRILARVFARKQASEAEYWQLADRLLDRDNPFDYNQAMMDLGSMVCTVKQPACTICPLSVICQGKDAPLDYPAPSAKKTIPVRMKHIIVFHEGERYFLQPRTSRFLHGLYGFMEVDQADHEVVFEGKSYDVSSAPMIGQVMQTYSHFKLMANVVKIELTAAGRNWKTIEEIRQLPLSKADEKVLMLL